MKTLPERTAVIIPCYNEGPTIQKVVSDFKKTLPNTPVFVFDNNSTDGTAQLAQEAGATVIREKRQGKGNVVAAMLRKIDADYYLMADGDDTYPAESALDLLNPIYRDEADMIVGERLSTCTDRAFPAFHFLGNQLIRGAINLIFCARLTDVLSGYRAFNREVADMLAITSIGFDVETEITLQALQRNMILREIPVPYRERPDGSNSKLNTFKDGFCILFKIFGMFKAYKPLTFFGGLGLLCWTFSALPLLTIFQNLDPQDPLQDAELGILSAAGFSVGLILASIGITLNTLNTRILELDQTLSKQIARPRFLSKPSSRDSES